MEKELEKSTVVLCGDDDQGVVQIADEVVMMIAALATAEVDGVGTIGGISTSEFTGRVNKKYLRRGVRVEVLEGNVSVGVAITVQYGINIPTLCAKVQSKVKNALENMTGLTCSDVNVRIVAMDMKKDKKDK
ncbi:MAG: Asp23/Gls24 family envelope stress response protein [Lachnospiraceae bacterium]|nr:Asp23/Gls24 family envelope stress response protein [Lachnospiraceae bacterium]